MGSLVKTRPPTVLLVLFLILASLYGVYLVPSVYALTSSNENSILLLNAVNVTLVGDEPTYSVKPINTTLTLNESGCPCCGGASNNTQQLNYSPYVILNESMDDYTLIFAGINVFGIINDTDINYTFYLLLYHSVHYEYNATIVTTIFTDPTNQNKYIFFRTVANIQPTQDKAMQVMDIINIMNKTTLSQHYKILSKTLKYLGDKEESTKWIWKKLGNELNKLSKIVEHQLKQYDTQKAYGTAIITDDFWCELTCEAICRVGGVAALCIAFPEFCLEIIEYSEYACSIICYIICG